MTTAVHKRIDDIEALRAFAVVFTLLEHVRYVYFWNGRFTQTVDHFFSFTTGVDLFLCISGFVIARSLLGELAAAPDRTSFWKSVIAFWIRRVYRTWPTSLLWLGVIVVASALFREPGFFFGFRENLANAAAVLTQTANFYGMACLPRNDCGGAGPWWSLSLEEQFYLLLPLTILISGKRLPIVLSVVAVAQLFLPRPGWSFLWVFRTDALALGVLLAIFSRSALYRMLDPKFMARGNRAIAVVGLLLFLLAELPDAGSKLSVIPFPTGMIALVSLALVAIASFDRGYIARGWVKPVLLWVGSRSYSIYLIHWVSMEATKTLWWYAEPKGTHFDGTYSIKFGVVWLVTTLIVSELNYRFLETPLRKRGAHVARALKGDLKLGHEHERRTSEAGALAQHTHN